MPHGDFLAKNMFVSQQIRSFSALPLPSMERECSKYVESIPVTVSKIKILKTDFHNLNLVFHSQILVSGFCDRFHSNQHVRIMFPPNFGDLGMSKKITPFFLPKCPLGHAGS